jgi:thermitase
LSVLAVVAQPGAVVAQTAAPPVSKPPATVEVYPHVTVQNPGPVPGQVASPSRVLKTTVLKSGRHVIADRLLVRYQTGLSAADLTSIGSKASQLGAGPATPLIKLGASTTYIVDITGAASMEAAAAAYKAADPRVADVGFDMLGQLDESPNDPGVGPQWALDAMHLPQAWDRTHATATQPMIAILDTGIMETHPDLTGKVALHNDIVGSGNTGDIVGHGTHVAGIAAAVTDNNFGIAGVGFDSRLMNGKIADWDPFALQVYVPVSALTSGIYWASDNGAAVINASVGGGDSCDPAFYEEWFGIGVQALRDSINYAWQRNVVVVASAGNHFNADKQWPAACPHVVSVASVADRFGTLASDSTHGPWVTLAAPGVGIVSAMVPGGKNEDKCNGALDTNPQDLFKFCSGTSMAAPHVAGLAALVRSSCNLTLAQDLVDQLTSTADQVQGTGTNFAFGFVDAANAVCMPTPIGFTARPVSATGVQLGWSDVSSNEQQFLISFRPMGLGPFSQISVPGSRGIPPNPMSFVVNGLTGGTTYEFQVQACDARGCSTPTPILRAAPDSQMLHATVTVGAGRVTSNPAGISCGFRLSQCNATFATGAQVTLTAVGLVDASGNEFDFDHWEGDCAAAGTFPACTLTMNGPHNVVAVMVKVGYDPPGH